MLIAIFKTTNEKCPNDSTKAHNIDNSDKENLNQIKNEKSY